MHLTPSQGSREQPGTCGDRTGKANEGLGLYAQGLGLVPCLLQFSFSLGAEVAGGSPAGLSPALLLCVFGRKSMTAARWKKSSKGNRNDRSEGHLHFSFPFPEAPTGVWWKSEKLPPPLNFLPYVVRQKRMYARITVTYVLTDLVSGHLNSSPPSVTSLLGDCGKFCKLSGPGPVSVTLPEKEKGFTRMTAETPCVPPRTALPRRQNPELLFFQQWVTLTVPKALLATGFPWQWSLKEQPE